LNERCSRFLRQRVKVDFPIVLTAGIKSIHRFELALGRRDIGKRWQASLIAEMLDLVGGNRARTVNAEVQNRDACVPENEIGSRQVARCFLLSPRRKVRQVDDVPLTEIAHDAGFSHSDCLDRRVFGDRCLRIRRTLSYDCLAICQLPRPKIYQRSAVLSKEAQPLERSRRTYSPLACADVVIE
jgi:hypothetical protein